ncbi:hypothetical protein BH23CHL2_BH23CHL2_08170 [soil metagenome]
MMARDDRIELMLDQMRVAWMPEGEGVEAGRGAFEAVARLFPEPAGVVEETMLLGGVQAITAAPRDGLDDDAPMILYLHGGAFLIGSAAIYREQSARLATAANARTVTLDYRLAPEHPYPAALDDTVNAFLALTERGVQPGRIVIAGDSAGGNLALAGSMRLRDFGQPLPAGLVLLSPWVDLSCSGKSMETNANPRHLAQRQGLLESASAYLAGEPARSPLASPLFGALTQLPPVLIQVGSLETLLDDSRELARRASAASANVRLQIFDDMIHEWHLLSALLPSDQPLEEAKQAVEGIGKFIREVTAQ